MTKYCEKGFMSKLLERVDSLQNTIDKLLKNYQQLQHRVETLNKENNDLKRDNKNLQEELNSFEAQYSSLKAANAMLGSKEYKKETKLKINSMIRELDACIAHLAE